MAWLRFLVVSAVLALIVQAHSEISKGKLSVLNSEVKPGNLLPQFMFMMGSVEVYIILTLLLSLTYSLTQSLGWISWRQNWWR